MYWHFRDLGAGEGLQWWLWPLGFDWVPKETAGSSSQDPQLSARPANRMETQPDPHPVPGPPCWAQVVYLVIQKANDQDKVRGIDISGCLCCVVEIQIAPKQKRLGCCWNESRQQGFWWMLYIMLWIRNHNDDGILPSTTAYAKRGLFTLLLGK